MAAFILFFVVPSFIFPVFMGDSRYAKFFVFSLAIFFSLYRALKAKAFRFEANPMFLFFLCAFSLFLVPALFLQNGHSLFYFAIIFFVLMGGSTFRLRDFNLSSVQKWTVLSALWISFIGIQNYYGITFFNLQLVSGAFERSSIIATIGNVNYVSNYLASVLPITIVTYLTTTDKRWRILSFIATVTAAVTVLWGQTRSVYLGLFIALVVFFFFLCISEKRRLLNKSNLFGMALGAIMILALYAFPPGVPDNRKPLRLSVDRAQELRLDYYESTGSFYRRVFEWKTALEMFSESPIYGWGWGSYKRLSQDFQEKVTEKDPAYFGFYEKSAEAHSDLLQMLAETGIIGFGLWVGLLLYIGIMGVKQWLTTKNLMILAMFCGWLLIVVHSLTEFPLHMMPSAAIFTVFSGFLVSNGKRRVFPKAIGLLFLFVTLFFSFVFLRSTIADSLFAYGSYQKQQAETQYLRAMEAIGRTMVTASQTSAESPEWFEAVIQKEKSKAVEALSASYYRQYLLFTNALTADPDYAYANYEIPVLIGKMEQLSPRPPFLLFDFPPFRYTSVSAMRGVPEDYPELGRWIFSLKQPDREQIEYLYRYFRSLCLSLNSVIDASIYVNISRAAGEILSLYEKWNTIEPEEKNRWLNWMIYGYQKALRLDGARQYTEDLEWDHLDLEYLDALIRHHEDSEEVIFPILDHRLKLATVTLE
ncbi:MAG TPA: O-antigen ligase, partial [Thermotogota bacterium]|nr:O-antigen ligase [Thermotogota bacterium]